MALDTAGMRRALWRRLPARVDRRVVVAAWATLVVQVGIVGTGGLVRLTGSGLGCPTWPQCTADSLITTPEMGEHGVIEFGNRMLTFVVVLVAIVTFVLILRMRRERRDLFWLALVIGLYVPVQAVIGGITVLTGLNPYVVGLHLFASAVLVALSAVFVARVYAASGSRMPGTPRWYAVTAYLASGFVAVTVAVGILVTGSGPHSGDGGAARNGLDSAFLQHVHSWPAYTTLALTLVLVVGSWRRRRVGSLPLWTALLLGVEVAQIGVGLLQARTGLPILLVNIHMVLAMVLVAAVTAVVMHLTVPAGTSTASSSPSGRPVERAVRTTADA